MARLSRTPGTIKKNQYILKSVRAIAAGFAVSFIGSLPMGYLNVAAWKIHMASGLYALSGFLAGVVVVEGLLVLAICASVVQLARKTGLMKRIRWTSVIFLLVLAAAFYWHEETPSTGAWHFDGHGAFWMGIAMSAANIMQVPFWVGWCLYLVQRRYLPPGRHVAFALAAAAGTFCGMLAIVHALAQMTVFWQSFADVLLSRIMPIIFFLMAVVQIRELVRRSD